jgi:hypothetical protein
VRDFRSGGYNVLVCTSIGEEGLDIGEVDLIVCYDVSSSAIRQTQRFGRTGRQNAGRVVMLVTRGVEEEIYDRSLQNAGIMRRALAHASAVKFAAAPPPMLPHGMPMRCEQKELHAPGDEGPSPPSAPELQRQLKRALKGRDLPAALAEPVSPGEGARMGRWIPRGVDAPVRWLDVGRWSLSQIRPARASGVWGECGRSGVLVRAMGRLVGVGEERGMIPEGEGGAVRFESARGVVRIGESGAALGGALDGVGGRGAGKEVRCCTGAEEGDDFAEGKIEAHGGAVEGEERALPGANARASAQCGARGGGGGERVGAGCGWNDVVETLPPADTKGEDEGVGREDKCGGGSQADWWGDNACDGGSDGEMRCGGGDAEIGGGNGGGEGGGEGGHDGGGGDGGDGHGGGGTGGGGGDAACEPSHPCAPRRPVWTGSHAPHSPSHGVGPSRHCLSPGAGLSQERLTLAAYQLDGEAKFGRQQPAGTRLQGLAAPPRPAPAAYELDGKSGVGHQHPAGARLQGLAASPCPGHGPAAMQAGPPGRKLRLAGLPPKAPPPFFA